MFLSTHGGDPPPFLRRDMQQVEMYMRSIGSGLFLPPIWEVTQNGLGLDDGETSEVASAIAVVENVAGVVLEM